MVIANDFKTAKKVVGIKQTTKALENGKAKLVVVASDADARVIEPLLEFSKAKSVSVEHVESMQELGKLCGIQVGAAAVALLTE